MNDQRRNRSSTAERWHHVAWGVSPRLPVRRNRKPRRGDIGVTDQDSCRPSGAHKSQSAIFLGLAPQATRCRRFAAVGGMALLVLFCVVSPLNADDDPARLREVLVPFEDLNILLKDAPRRVLMSREQYEKLLDDARKAPRAKPAAPRKAAVVAANYAATLGQGRIEIKGALTVDVLEDGLHVVELDLKGVGLRRASVAGKDAPIGRGKTFLAFVEGKGRRTLDLDLVAPVTVDAARQWFKMRLPVPAATRFSLIAKGQIDVDGEKTNASVKTRIVDVEKGTTAIEFVPPRGQDMNVVMTLNTRIERTDRLVVARGVIVSEVTAAYEKLHAAVSMAVLHSAVERFRFAVPKGFEVADVSARNIAQWTVENDVLEVLLREPATGTVLFNLTLARNVSGVGIDQPWQLPRLRPLDVAGEDAVLGLLVEDRLNIKTVSAQGMVPIDTGVFASALPASVLTGDDVKVRPVAAYYAPQVRDEGFSLSAQLEKTPASLNVLSNLLFIVDRSGHRVRGAFALTALKEKRFSVDFSVPDGWHVQSVADEKGKAVRFERTGNLIRVRLPGFEPGKQGTIQFTAATTPGAWLDEWDSKQVVVPSFVVQDAALDTGAVAIDARDDLEVRPAEFAGLTPLDETDKKNFGLDKVAADLAYRYDKQPYQATIDVAPIEPRLTARTYSFFRVEADALVAHYEIIYDVQQAATRQLSFVLPKSTPTALSIKGLDKVKVKGYSSFEVEDDADTRLWTATLTEAHRGSVRLTINFQQRVDHTTEGEKALPLVRADAVQYQSGFVAVEGSSELDVEVTKHPRPMDIGELADADYEPGRHLLGAYGFIGDPPVVSIKTSRPPAYALPRTIVQRAEITTAVSAGGMSHNSALFVMRTKALFMEIHLPPKATLWGVMIDGKPAKPQHDGKNLLLDIQNATIRSTSLRRLHVVYQAPIGQAGMFGDVNLTAPSLRFHSGDQTASVEVPIADLNWRFFLPPGYSIRDTGGTVTIVESSDPPLAISNVADWVYRFGGGGYGGVMMPLGSARKSAQQMQSSTQIRGVHQAMVTFSQANKFYYPGDLGTLMVDDFFEPEYLISPADDITIPPDFSTWSDERRRQWANENSSYIMLDPDGRDDLNTSKIEVMEKFGPHKEGIWVVYGDNHAEWLPNAEARRRLAEQLLLREGSNKGNFSPWGPSNERRKRIVEQLRNLEESGLVGGPVLPGDSYQMAKSGLRSREIESLDELIVESKKLPANPHEGKNPARIVVPSAQLAETPAAPKADPAKPPKIAITAEREQRPPVLTAPEPEEVRAGGRDDLLGLRSLKIKLQGVGQAVMFNSLGVDPRVSVRLADGRRLRFLGWALTLIVVVMGLRRSRQPVSNKVKFVFWTGAVATIIAIISGRSDVVALANAVFYGAALLVPVYLALGFGRWFVRRVKLHQDAVIERAKLVVASAAVVAFCFAGVAFGANEDDDDGPPVKVPNDVLIVPYDVEAKEGVAGVKPGDQVMVPYDVYVKLWQRAHPGEAAPLLDGKLPGAPAVVKKSATFAFAGGQLTGTLPGDAADGEFLTLAGHIDIDVFDDSVVQVPLSVSGVVLANAKLDGKAAKLNVVAPAKKGAVPRLVLHVQGKGRHRLDLAVRMRLQRRGGWRIAEGVMPVAPAMGLTLVVPEAQTDVWIQGVSDRRQHETKNANQQIETALNPTGQLRVQWRAKVSKAEVDLGLKVMSSVVMDVQEDGVRLAWLMRLFFPRSERDAFTVSMPSGYLVERVVGDNVRGWRVRKEADRDLVDVTLLKPATDRAVFAMYLRRPGEVGSAGFDAIATPVIEAEGSALHNGLLTIRRSPLMNVRTTAVKGVTRTDVPKGLEKFAGSADQTPMGIRPYEAYRFDATPFDVNLAAAPVEAQVSAELQTILGVSERRRYVDGRIELNVLRRPVFYVRVAIPDGLKLDRVFAPGSSEWSVLPGEPRVLNVMFQKGLVGRLPIVISGTLGEEGEFVDTVALPQLRVMDVQRQEGSIAVLVDPSFNVLTKDLQGCESVLLKKVTPWLKAAHRRQTRLALQHRDGNYSGAVTLVRRQAEVTATTVTNVRVTDRAIEETILLDFVVRKAGLRELSFLLPKHMSGSQFSAPLLRQKTVEDVDDQTVRVKLELQDDLIGQIRVMVSNDRLLTDDVQRAPVAVVETGRVERQFVALENTGRDEAVIEKLSGLVKLSRQQKEWQTVAALFAGGSTQAFIVRGDGADDPLMSFKTRRRQAVQTAGARIGLAQTMLVLDENGAYRASQSYRVDNSTEQYLEIELPDGAALWAVRVSGQPVKPSNSNIPRVVRIPLVKTAAGDLDYEVVIKYAGKMPPLGTMESVSFPMVRTKNINVELSQARLFLPRGYKWFSFDGSMRHVTRGGELEAGYLSYLNKQAQRLMVSLRDEASAFTKIRGKASYEQLKGKIESYNKEQKDQSAGYTELWGRNQAQQERALSNLEQQVQRLSRQKETTALDNRGNLKLHWRGQKNSSAIVVDGLTPNFDADYGTSPNEVAGKGGANQGQAGAGGGGEVFNGKWFDSNNLRGPGPGSVGSGQQKQEPGKSRLYFNHDRQGAMNQADNGELRFDDFIKDKDGERESEENDKTPGDDEKLHKYEQRVQQRTHSRVAGAFHRLPGGGESDEDSGGEFAYGGDATPIAAGLTSLDVGLAFRGEEFRFTTPRGDVKITARAVSGGLLETLKELGILLATMAICMALFRVVQRHVDWLIGRAATTLMILFGLFSLIIGPLPLLGLVLLTTGIVLKLHRRRQVAVV